MIPRQVDDRFFRCGFIVPLPLTPLGIEPFLEVRQWRITHLFKLNNTVVHGVPPGRSVCEDARNRSADPRKTPFTRTTPKVFEKENR